MFYRTYDYKGPYHPVEQFYEERLKATGWQLNQPDDHSNPQYTKSYGGWKAQARLAQGVNEFQLAVIVNPVTPSYCDNE